MGSLTVTNQTKGAIAATFTPKGVPSTCLYLIPAGTSISLMAQQGSTTYVATISANYTTYVKEFQGGTNIHWAVDESGVKVLLQDTAVTVNEDTAVISLKHPEVKNVVSLLSGLKL